MSKSKRWAMMRYCDVGYQPLELANEVDAGYIHWLAEGRGWKWGEYRIWPVEPFDHPVVESVVVYFAGEPAAGINSSSFDVECHIDPFAVDSDERRTVLEMFRCQLTHAYELIMGQRPSSVKFDFEWEGECDNAW